MPFNLNFPKIDESDEKLQLEPSETLYILGANGTGKSSLLQFFKRQTRESSQWISAHRQTWLHSDASDISLANKPILEENIYSADISEEARYRDDLAYARTGIPLQNLIASENSRALAITDKVDRKCIQEALELSDERRAPIKIINDLFQQSNIPIHLRIGNDECLMACKGNDAEYGASEMSDGERNALLIAANVLTAPDGTLLLIDEPERHLHHSIAAPLLTHLFELRKDCGFVVSTHDIDLPMRAPEAHVLLLRGCSFEQNNVQCWTADKLEPGAEIEEEFKRDLLGARRQIFFVEGDENSLDKRLYSCIFPSVSVIPKGGCVEVERAVAGFKSGDGLHWLEIYGIVDADGLDDDKITANKQQKGVYTLPYYSVEAFYYCPIIIERLAELQESNLGKNMSTLYNEAIAKGVAAIGKHTSHLSKNKAKRVAEKRRDEQLILLSGDKLLTDFDQTIQIKGSEIHQKIEADLTRAVCDNSWEEILKICPIRKSGAKNAIAKALHFNDSEDYESAVIQMLLKDEKTRNFVRSLFGKLANSLSDMDVQQRNAE